MSAFVLSKVSAAQMRGAYGQIKRRWLHGSLKRQAIMMPAMSPLMTEGTITRWKIKEGEAFAPGDVLLQIESDIAMIDVEAHSPGILGKILLPDGTTNVPVEQVIALVAKDMSELAALQSSTTPTLTSFNTIPALNPLAGAITSPRQLDQFKLPLMSPRTPTLSPRTPSLFEMHTMGYGFRNAHVGGPRGAAPRLDLKSVDAASECRVDVPPCPSPRIQTQDRSMSINSGTASWPTSAKVRGSVAQVDDQAQIDGAAIRKIIVSNLFLQSANSIEYFDELV
ncbi:single hybrid motif-containing protein [Phlegmacium glaucopus]|nr:single hybrid motif-containing protein [Phlegmacium glaucopus]